MWQAHLSKQNLHLVDPTVFHDFENKLEEVKAAVMNPFHEVIIDSRFLHIHPPNNAYTQAFEALDRLGKEFGAWRDFVEVVRGLQHNLLKLFAFADWWHDIQQGDDFRSLFHGPIHGSLFDNEDLYANHAHWSIASYLIAPNDRFVDLNKWVNLSPHNKSQMDAMSIQPLLHSLHLWYYPPHVTDVCANFELAACGYAEHLDTFILTKGFKHMLDKLDNQRADEGTSFFYICSCHHS